MNYFLWVLFFLTDSYGSGNWIQKRDTKLKIEVQNFHFLKRQH